MATAAVNKLKYLLATKVIDFANDQFNIILVGSGFAFDPTDEVLADVSAFELQALYGYTTGGNILLSVAVTEDSANNRVDVTWANTTWTASGGTIGPAVGAIIYDYTVQTPLNPLVGFIDFGGDQYQVDGGVATISNIMVRLQ